jgi:ABC-type molybdate transport system substrate-binding protein
MAGAKEAEAGMALIKFLRTPAATAVIKAKGMEPAAPR